MSFSHTHLRVTHKRLSLLFTFLVSGTVFVMGLSFLFAQHISDARAEKSQFFGETQRIIEQIERTDDFLERFFMTRLQIQGKRNFPRFE